MNDKGQRLISTTGIATTIGLGICIFTAVYRRQILQKIYNWLPNNSSRSFKYRCVNIANTPDECKIIAKELKKNCTEFNVLGFDCEWVTVNGGRRPVSLLQLATHNGYCALIRLCKFNHFPLDLLELLEDNTILKVGIDPIGDAGKLAYDYGVNVASTLDLRYIAHYLSYTPLGLAKMSKNHLHIELNKDWRISCSNWESFILNDTQIRYAADDAQVAIELFKFFQNDFKKKYPFWKIYNNRKSLNDILSVSMNFIDMSFNGANAMNILAKRNQQHDKRHARAFHTDTIGKPFYENCHLEAPDGELLGIVNKRKADWYINKNIGTLIKNEPYTVRLTFEPANRTEGDDAKNYHKYYQAPKENICVVCGKTNTFLCKSVIPKEYRKHFPDILKKYSSHDLLPLCPRCHQISNLADTELRKKLAKMCNAPLDLSSGERRLNSLKSMAKALLYQKDRMPKDRIQQLENEILKYHHPVNVKITNELLTEMLHLKTLLPSTNEHFNDLLHGEKVVEFFKNHNEGLTKLEMIWREHFLQKMKPKYLPPLWSIDHNSHRLKNSREVELQENLDDVREH